MPADADDVVRRLREACVGHPHARIDWPHRILHESAAFIEGQDTEMRQMRKEMTDTVSEMETTIERQSSEIATLRAQVAALEKECERARVAGCSPTLDPDAPLS